MPAKEFICPNGERVPIGECLAKCPQGERCMFLPTLRAIAEGLDRGLTEPTVTELLAGTRETYLKKTTDYAVSPMDQVFALHGSSMHAMQENHSEGNMLTEVRLYDGKMSGQFDIYGTVLDETSNVLGDYKVTSSYKAMKALGYYTTSEPTGEYYKSGAKKGQEKYKKVWHTDGERDIEDWTIQLNYYRIQLERRGFKVDRMEIQMLIRDFSTRMASERNITKPVYVISIPKIRDDIIEDYLGDKLKKLNLAIKSNTIPEHCDAKENWEGRKCLGYCSVVDKCDFGCMLKRQEERKAA